MTVKTFRANPNGVSIYAGTYYGDYQTVPSGQTAAVSQSANLAGLVTLDTTSQAGSARWVITATTNVMGDAWVDAYFLNPLDSDTIDGGSL
jgi:hypothetical protein